MDAIASHLVLPNRLTVPLVADLHVAQLRSPLPRVTVSIMNGLEKNMDPHRLNLFQLQANTFKFKQIRLKDTDARWLIF